MKLYGAIDLHSSNNVTVVIDEQDRVVYQKRLPKDLAMIVEQLSVYRASLVQTEILERTITERVQLSALPKDHELGEKKKKGTNKVLSTEEVLPASG